MTSQLSAGEDAGAAQSMTLMDQTSMDHRHMDMGPHMKMTALRDLKPGDTDRAAKVAENGASSRSEVHRLSNGSE